MTVWAVIGHDGQEARAMSLRGSTIVHEARGPDTNTAVSRLDPVPEARYRIGEGRSVDLPAALLPGPSQGLPGLSQTSPPDLLDGWVRLLLIGLVRQRPDWDGVAWIIGRDLSHWVQISAAEAVSCQSFLTPKLRGILGGGLPPCPRALSDSLSRPERLAAHLRTAQVSGDAAALSGYLLGAELAAARPYWLGQSVSLVAESACAAGHADALEAMGVQVVSFEPDSLLPSACAALAQSLGHADAGRGAH
ncbi:2-dehydro-3-deoxygalactonokinase [uncultured Roseovarius sp.]|uniref:2-dehydro-3-deoxygalactonokinase n=1 Tax=uncultured Roseovarius sp. TaxID=293344 RepID=UPI0026342CE5|nr:2-dehydro-3-deoxygalactonokinase [uncultured Roseovarius sp.]